MFVTTGYSFRTAIGKIPDVVSRLKELGYTHGAIADIGGTWGFTDWRDECLKQGLKPVYGVQLAVSPNPSAKKPVSDIWTFVARHNIQPINELVALATSQFRYQPLLTYQQACAADCFVITGHKAQLDEFEPMENLFIGLSPACSKGYVKAATAKGFDFCAAQNNRYPLVGDCGLWEVICGHGASSQTYPQHIIDFEDWLIGLPRDCGNITLKARQNFDKITDACESVILPQAKMVNFNSNETLREMCMAAIASRGLETDEYRERLETELSLIEDKNFEDYFFVVADLMKWARKEMLCGPGRGSSAGSLVCFLLDITAVDPVKHGTLFFRFLDPSRPDLPDIDSDFEDRDAAIEYLSDKYGTAHVAKIGAPAAYQVKNSANEACKALGVPKYEIEPVLGAVIKYAGGDSRSDGALKEAFETTSKGKSFINKYPHMVVAGDMGGNPRHAGTHAGGVVITNEPISEFVAIDAKIGTAQIEKNNAETRGLVKLDILGLSILEIFHEALKLAGLPMDTLDKLTYDDQTVFDILNDGKFTGTFQFSEHTVKGLAKEVKIESFEDIATVSALGRPGPLSSGSAAQWVKRKNVVEPVNYPHKLLEPYLKETLGVLVFQETIMLIAHDIAGMDWATVAKLRKAISKSQGDKVMAEFGEPFKAGLMKAGIDETTAGLFWHSIMGFGAYGFNKSHSVAYAMVTYWSLWLKRYYPLEFAAASLSFRTKVENQVELLRELATEGVGYVPVDPENSTDRWRVVTKDGIKSLVGPITLVKGLGPKMCSQVLSCRARGEPIPERAAKLLTNPVTEIDSLFPIEKAISEIDLSNFSFSQKPKKCNEIVCTGDWEDDTVLLGLVTSFKERDDNEPQMVEGRISRGQVGIKTGLTTFLDIRVADSTGECYYKIEAKNLEEMTSGLTLVENKTLVAVRGTICPDVPMVLCKQIRVIGNV